jgi:hypothetical protein
MTLSAVFPLYMKWLFFGQAEAKSFSSSSSGGAAAPRDPLKAAQWLFEQNQATNPVDLFAFCETSSQRPWRRGAQSYWHWYLLNLRPRAAEHMQTLLEQLPSFLEDFLTERFHRRFPDAKQFASVFKDKLMENPNKYAPATLDWQLVVSADLHRLTPGLVTMFSEPIRKKILPHTVTREAPLFLALTPRLRGILERDRRQRLADSVMDVLVFQALLSGSKEWRSSNVPAEPWSDAADSSWRQRVRTDVLDKLPGADRADVLASLSVLFDRFWANGRLDMNSPHLHALMDNVRRQQAELDSGVSLASLERLQNSLKREQEALQRDVVIAQVWPEVRKAVSVLDDAGVRDLVNRVTDAYARETKRTDVVSNVASARAVLPGLAPSFMDPAGEAIAKYNLLRRQIEPAVHRMLLRGQVDIFKTKQKIRDILPLLVELKAILPHVESFEASKHALDEVFDAYLLTLLTQRSATDIALPSLVLKRRWALFLIYLFVCLGRVP